MYFDDLTPYVYMQPSQIDDVRHVGWLERDHSFNVGVCDSRVPDALERYYRQLETNKTRGLYGCPFCPDASDDELSVAVAGRRIWLGAAELWVPAPHGGAFAAPDMVIHYIREHSYRPPDAFIAAVLALPVGLEHWAPEQLLQSGTKAGT